MERITTQEKMHLLQERQALLRGRHRKLMDTLDGSQLGAMERSMVRQEIQSIRRQMMENRTGPDGLRSLNNQLRSTRKTEPEWMKELRSAGVEIEKYEEPLGYPDDENMI